MSIGQQNHVLGREQAIYVEFENPSCDFVPPQGLGQTSPATNGNAFNVLTSNFDRQQPRENRNDARATRSLQQRMSRGIEVAWDFENFAQTSGLQGTPPDIHQFLFALMGTYTPSAGVSDTYGLSASQTLRTLSLTRYFSQIAGGIFMEGIVGATVESGTLSLALGDEPRWAFNGLGIDMAHTGIAALNGALAGGEDTGIDIAAASINNIFVDSVVQIGTSTGAAGLGHLVIAVDRTANTIDIDPAQPVVGAQGAAAAVVPFAPTPILSSAEVLNGINAQVDLGTLTDLPTTGFSVTIANQNKELREAGKATAQDVKPGFRLVTGEVTVYMRADQIIQLGDRRLFTPKGLTIRVGQAGTPGDGNRITVNAPAAEIEFSPAEIPQEEEGLVTLPFTALQSAAPEDELTIVYD